MDGLSEALKHIDLMAVLSDMDGYEYGLIEPHLGNIPPPLCDAVFTIIEELVGHVTDPVTRSLWDSNRLAIEVSDLVDDELERLVSACEDFLIEEEKGIEALSHRLLKLKPLEARLAQVEAQMEVISGAVWGEKGEEYAALETLCIFFASASIARPDDYIVQLCLLLFKYDRLSIFYSLKDLNASFRLYESIADSRGQIDLLLGKSFDRHLASIHAKKRHAENSKNRELAIKRWQAEGQNFSSINAFARLIYKEYGVTSPDTVARWIQRASKAPFPTI